MNRRSFLLGLATIPVAGVAAVAAPTVVVGIDGGGPGACCAYIRVNGEAAYWDEEHVFRGECSVNRLRSSLNDKPDGFLKMITTNARSVG